MTLGSQISESFLAYQLHSRTSLILYMCILDNVQLTMYFLLWRRTVYVTIITSLVLCLLAR